MKLTKTQQLDLLWKERKVLVGEADKSVWVFPPSWRQCLGESLGFCYPNASGFYGTGLFPEDEDLRVMTKDEHTEWFRERSAQRRAAKEHTGSSHSRDPTFES